MTKRLHLPDSLIDDENVLKMLTLLFPCTVDKILPGCFRAERKLFVQTFKENNARLRQDFFSDPLAKYLWSQIFIEEASEMFVMHLRWIRSQPVHGAKKFDRFLKDMKQLEITCNFKMLTENGKDANSDITKTFTQQEEYKYLVENGRYNKRQTDKIRGKIENLKNTIAQRLDSQTENDE